MLGVNQKDSYNERILKNTLMRIPIRKELYTKEERSTLYYYKKPQYPYKPRYA